MRPTVTDQTASIICRDAHKSLQSNEAVNHALKYPEVDDPPLQFRVYGWTKPRGETLTWTRANVQKSGSQYP